MLDVGCFPSVQGANERGLGSGEFSRLFSPPRGRGLGRGGTVLPLCQGCGLYTHLVIFLPFLSVNSRQRIRIQSMTSQMPPPPPVKNCRRPVQIFPA